MDREFTIKKKTGRNGLNLNSNANYNKTSSITKNQPAANGYVLKNAPKWTATDSVGIFLSNTHPRNRRFDTYYRISVGRTVLRHPS